MLEVPQELLDSRRRNGADRWDEMWDGVLHMVPTPSGDHQGLAMDLLQVLLPLAHRAGLVPRFETGLFRPGTDMDYRIPDQTYALPEQLTARAIDGGAPFIVEIRSPDDETYDKLPFYRDIGVGELLVIDPPSRRVELFVNGGGRWSRARRSSCRRWA
jgi:Uma2 family endonuclease